MWFAIIVNLKSRLNVNSLKTWLNIKLYRNSTIFITLTLKEKTNA
jgi:hypothetical protein